MYIENKVTKKSTTNITTILFSTNFNKLIGIYVNIKIDIILIIYKNQLILKKLLMTKKSFVFGK